MQFAGLKITRHESDQGEQIEQNGLIALQALLGDGNIKPIAVTT